MANTIIASGRIPRERKKRVDDILSGLGMKASDLISEAYAYVDKHSALPWSIEDLADDGEALYQNYLDLLATMPAESHVDNMSAQDLRDEYAKREA